MNDQYKEELYQFHRLLSNLGRSVRRKYRHWMREKGFKHYYFRLLHHVDQDNPPKLTDLSNRSITKKSNITKLIDKLEEKRYVKRFRDEEDKRIWRVKLTKEGLKVKDNMIEEEKKFVQEIYKNIQKNKIKQYLQLVREISEDLNLTQEGEHGGNK